MTIARLIVSQQHTCAKKYMGENLSSSQTLKNSKLPPDWHIIKTLGTITVAQAYITLNIMHLLKNWVRMHFQVGKIATKFCLTKLWVWLLGIGYGYGNVHCLQFMLRTEAEKNFDMCEVEKIGHNTCYTLNRK